MLDDGAGDGGPDGGAELGEDVEAGGGDGLVGLVDVVDWEGVLRYFGVREIEERKEGRREGRIVGVRTEKRNGATLTQRYHTERDVDALGEAHDRQSHRHADDGANLRPRRHNDRDEPRRCRRARGQRRPIILARALHQEASSEIPHRAGNDAGQEQRARVRGVELQDRLIEEGQEEEEAEPAAGGEEVPAVNGGEGLVEDDAARDEGVGRHGVFDEDEEGEQDRAEGKGDDASRSAPAVVAAKLETYEEADDGADDEDAAQVVDLPEFGPTVGGLCALGRGELEYEGYC